MNDRLTEIEARRAARKAELAAQRDAQRVTDLDAVDGLEIEYGDSNVCTLDVPFTPGLPTLCAAKTPSEVLIKRYRDRTKTRKDGAPGDAVEAAHEIASACLVYPAPEVFADMCVARPGIKAQLGLEALKLAAGKTESEGKG